MPDDDDHSAGDGLPPGAGYRLGIRGPTPTATTPYRTHRVMFGEHVRVEQDETIYGAGHAWIHADAVIDEEGSPAVVEQYARQLRAASLRLRAILAGAAR